MTFRPDPKPEPKEKKKYKGIQRKPNPVLIKEKEELHFKDKIFYEGIWKKRIHKCQLCGDKLGEHLYWNFFHHILEKGRAAYEHLRHEDTNIILVCQPCHDKFHYAYPPQECLDVVSHTINQFTKKGLL